MSIAIWPATLPAYPRRDGFQRQPQPNIIATPTEVGGDKRRRRSTYRAQVWRLQFIMSAVQLVAFEDFFEGRLEDGALPFEFVHPQTAERWHFRFEVQSPYGVAPYAALESVVSLSVSGRRVGSAVQPLYVGPDAPKVPGGFPYLWIEESGAGEELSTLWLELGADAVWPKAPLQIGPSAPAVPDGMPFLWLEVGDPGRMRLWFEEGGTAEPDQPLYVGETLPLVAGTAHPYLWIEQHAGGDLVTLWLEDGNDA